MINNISVPVVAVACILCFIAVNLGNKLRDENEAFLIKHKLKGISGYAVLFIGLFLAVSIIKLGKVLGFH